jgi:hypothetical protein
MAYDIMKSCMISYDIVYDVSIKTYDIMYDIIKYTISY